MLVYNTNFCLYFKQVIKELILDVIVLGLTYDINIEMT